MELPLSTLRLNALFFLLANGKEKIKRRKEHQYLIEYLMTEIFTLRAN